MGPKSSTGTGNHEEEYAELNRNLRFYGNMRFAQLTVLIAVTAALITVIFTTTANLSALVKTTLKIGGVLATFVFWVMEERSTGYAMHFAKRINELEQLLGYKSWQGRRMGTQAVFSATNAVRLLYFCLGLFWLATLVWRSQF